MKNKIEVGDTVLIKNINITCQVIDKLNDRQYRVVRNNLVFLVDKDDLELKVVNNNMKVNKDNFSILDNYYEIDLHGYSKFEAIKEVKQIIENAHIHKFTKIYITHGKGKGILRMAIHDLLKTYKNNNVISSYEFAQDNKGGYGVTIVDI